MAFHVGQRVVCVRSGAIEGLLPPSIDGLKVGRVYTIRWLGEFPLVSHRSYGLGVRLTEIDRGADPCGVVEWDDYPLALLRFRPLIERKTNISSLVALLNPKNHKALEEA